MHEFIIWGVSALSCTIAAAGIVLIFLKRHGPGVICLIVAASILGLVTLISLPPYRKAKLATAKRQISSLAQALESYRSRFGEYPEKLPPQSEYKKDHSPKDAFTSDPWGQSVIYRVSDDRSQFIITSKGPDMTLGTADDIQIRSAHVESKPEI